MKHISLFLVTALLVLGCGDDKTGSKYDKLNDSQKGQFGQLMQATENSVDAAGELRKDKRPITFGFISKHPSQQKKVQSDMTAELKRAECAVEHTDPSKVGINQISLTPGSKGEWYFKMTGEKCPAALNTHFGWNVAESSADFTFKATYATNSEEFRKLNDVTAYDMSGALHLSGNQEAFQVVGETKGTIQSTQYGQVGVQLNAELKGSKDKQEFYVVLETKFSDFTAELKLMGNTKDQNSFEAYLNGEKIEAQEVKGILKLL